MYRAFDNTQNNANYYNYNYNHDNYYFYLEEEFWTFWHDDEEDGRRETGHRTQSDVNSPTIVYKIWPVEI